MSFILLTVPFVASAESYDYPLKDPLTATILSTPVADRARLPKTISAKYYQTIDIFPDRVIPEVFWYNNKLRYSVAAHKEQAPLIFMIAGTGAGYDSGKMKMMQKAFFQAGFHVIALSSPTHPNFIVAASSSRMPGDINSDAKDLYRVMEMIIAQEKLRPLVSVFYLTGYSLGGSQAAFIAQLDEQRRSFKFKKVLMINPALNIFDSAIKIDKMLEDNLPGGMEGLDAFYAKLVHNITVAYVVGDFVDLSHGFFYSAYNDILPGQAERAAVIGISFRISLSNLLFTADVMTRSGYIVPAELNLSATDSLTEYAKSVIYKNGFSEYVENIIYPVYRAKYPGLSLRELVDRSSLRVLEEYLRKSPKIGLVTNRDDFILADGDIEYFQKIMGARVKIYPRGGHCGNMGYKDNVVYMVNFFKESGK
ncbi:MAG: alpha/beta hydrolase [Deltaproteobacteria bacterium]|nr:alpha/beta hydrolase [Candidatus Tharpella sp.]